MRQRFGSTSSAAALALLAAVQLCDTLQAQERGSVLIHLFAGAPPGSYGVDLDLGIAPALSVVGSVQEWDSGTGCLLESLVCSRGGLSLGVGTRLVMFASAPVAPFAQLEAGHHRYARADVSVAYWAVRGGIRWQAARRFSVGLAIKRQTVGGAEYLEGPTAFPRSVPAASILSSHVILGFRIR